MSRNLKTKHYNVRRIIIAKITESSKLYFDSDPIETLKSPIKPAK